MGKLQETSRLAGAHIHNLRKEVDSLKASKAEAAPVASELDRLRGDVGEEFRTMRSELAKNLKELSEHTQAAFQQVNAVETSLQGHVSQGFTEAVAALQWLEAQTSDHFIRIEAELVQVKAEQASAPPPPTPVPNST